MNTAQCATGKVRYPSRNAAYRAIGKIGVRRYVYRCKLCGGYHLTSHERVHEKEWNRRRLLEQ